MSFGDEKDDGGGLSGMLSKAKSDSRYREMGGGDDGDDSGDGDGDCLGAAFDALKSGDRDKFVSEMRKAIGGE